MPVLETLELSEYQNWVWSSLKDWLRWKGLYLFCAPSLLLELAQEGHLSPHTAKAVIGNLEGYFATRPPQWRCSTKAPEQYGRQPLKGLWKAHVPFQDRSTIMKNLSNEINQSWMDRWFKKLIEPNDTHPLSEEQCGRIASLVVVTALKKRSSRAAMTGHWLVFSRVEDKNYYLTLASHEETDETIFARAKAAANFYPENDLLRLS